MKTLFIHFSLFFFFVLVLMSCGNNAKKEMDNNIRFDSLSINETYHIMDIETNPSCSLQVKFIYPVDFKDKEILTKIQQQFIVSYFGEDYANNSPQDAIKLYLEKYINDFKLQENDFLIDQQNHQSDPSESLYSNYEILNNDILYNQNNLISLIINRVYYKGGAHDAHSHINYVIDLTTGKRITENEIFVDDYKEDLANIIVNEIAQNNNVAKADDLENMGYFDIEEIFPNKNFYIDDKGINYTFNEFDIAAYVVGPIYVHIPYEKIRHLLRIESPISNIAF